MGNNDSRPGVVPESPLTSFFSTQTSALKAKTKPAEDKDSKLQRALESEIQKRNADIKMLKMQCKDHANQMNTELQASNKSAAYQHHKATVNLNAQISQIQMCTAKLQKELMALYTHKMHASTMALMKQTSRHLVKSTASAGSVENAIQYADAIAEAHSTVEEVSDALNYGDADTDDDSWQQVLSDFNDKKQAQIHSSEDTVSLVAAAAPAPLTKPQLPPTAPSTSKPKPNLNLGL